MVVSLSTTESEYRGAINVGIEVVWIGQLLEEVVFPIETLAVIHCDDHSTIQVFYNDVSHNKMKHIELHVHFLR